MKYNEKVVLITGARSSLGKELIEYFVKCKAKVITTYNNSKDDVLDYVNKINDKYNVLIDCLELDLHKEESIIDLYNYVNKKYKKVNILINNAALSQDNFIMDKTKNEFMEVLEVNLVGTFLMMKYFDNITRGYIFNMSSTDGIDTGNIYSIDYNASKAGINSITKTFSLYSKNKIISICPNWIDTESTRSMDKNYLENELKRVKQDKLISPKLISEVIDKCISDNVESGSIIRVEGEGNVRRID